MEIVSGGREPIIGKQFQFGRRFSIKTCITPFFLSHFAPSMDDAKSPISTLRRRNSIGPPSTLTVQTKHHHPSSSTTTTSSSSADFELLSLKPASYTSLRDILPSTAAVVQSPKVSTLAAHSGYEIPIRNRLVKQAAWAYLRPMSTSPDSGGSTVFHRLWNRFSDACLCLVTQIFDCLLQSIQVRTTTSRL